MQSWNTCGGDAWCLYRDVGIHPGYSASLCVQLSQSCLVPEYMHGSQGLNLSVVAASFLRACSRSLHSRRCSDLVLVCSRAADPGAAGPMELGWAKAVPVQDMVPIPEGEGPALAAAAGAPVRGTRGAVAGSEPGAVLPALSGHGRPAGSAWRLPVCCRCSSSALRRTGWWCGRAGGRGGCQRRLASQSQTNRWRQHYPITQGLSGRG